MADGTGPVEGGTGTSPASAVPPRAKDAGAWLLVPMGAAVLGVLFGGYELLERYVLAPRFGMEFLHAAHLIRGIAASVVLAALVAWFLLRKQPTGPEPVSPEPGQPLVDRVARERQHARWFVRMRWIACGLALPLIVIAVPITGILPLRALSPLLAWWGVMLLSNVVFSLWAERGGRFARQTFVQAATDLVVLTGFLNASGGIENPLYVAYVFHVIIAGVLLPRPRVFGITVIAAGLVAALAFGEYLGLIPHYTNVLFPHAHARMRPLPPAAAAGEEAPPEDASRHVHGDGAVHLHDAASQAPAEGVHDAASLDALAGAVVDPLEGHAAHDPLFVAGRLLPFVCVLFLSAYLTTLVADRLHRSEAELERTAQAALLERVRLESVVDAAGVGIILLDPDQAVRWSSRLSSGWLEREAHPPDGPCPHGGLEKGCRACLVARTFETGLPQETERTVGAPGAGLRYFRFATSPVRDAEGAVVQVVELCQDVSARKALESRALHAGKLSVLGRMAAGIAHEIGNPLSSLTARLDLIERRDDPEFVRDSLGVLRSQISRIGRIVHGVSHFGRPRGQEWAEWELNDVASEAVELVRVDRRALRIEFRRHLKEPSPRVRGVRDQILQVCLNLLLNAVEASRDGMAIDVVTRLERGEATLAVVDQGAGMLPKDRDRLFEPFFTTKREGTGLGLSISWSMVHAHGGRIDVESEPGRGSRFTVALPVAGASRGQP